MMNNMNKVKMIYSETVGTMIPYGFIRKFSKSDEVIIGQEHFTWCEDDCIYYSDDIDGKGYFEEDVHESFIRHSTGHRVDFIFDVA